jgi:cation diffusion facilitator family transporter
MQRKKEIRVASWVSLIGNSILAVLKIVIGMISGSLAVIADGVDSSIDILMSFITLITSRLIARPPDKKFAYGYEKADAIAAKVLSFFIFFAGAQLAFTTIKKITLQEQVSFPGMLAVYVTLFSVAGKIFLSYYLARKGKMNHSAMLIANAKNMKYDILISVTVLVGLFFTLVLNITIADTIAALFISGWVMWGALRIFIDTNTELMDGVDDTSVYDKIFEAASAVAGVNNPHRVRSRQIGKMHMIVIDIEVDGGLSLKDAHAIAQKVEKNIRRKVENVYDIVVHTEPLGNIETDERDGITGKDLD